MATLEQGVVAFEIAWSCFLHFFWEATLGKGSLEISGCFGIIFLFFLWQPLEKGVYFFLVAPLGQ